jgi:hypothetical protein
MRRHDDITIAAADHSYFLDGTSELGHRASALRPGGLLIK